MMDMKDLRYRFDQVEIDVSNLRVMVGQEIRPLEPKSFRLLLFLVQNPHRAISKEELMGAVWPDVAVSDNSLARAITQIRKVLDDDPKAPRYVETVPSVGYRFIADCKEEISGGAGTLPVTTDAGFDVPVVPTRRFPAGPWLVAAGGVLLGVAAIAFVFLRGGGSANLPEMRVEIDTPATNDPRSFALSPDGRELAYVATTDGVSRLWVRQLASTRAQPLAVTEGGAAYPFWSPDSRSIGFFSAGKLKRIEASGGAPQVLADAKSGRGGTWNQDGVILFTPTPQSPVLRVSAAGGEPIPATRLIGAEVGNRFPQFLPDGKHFVVLVEGTADRASNIGSIHLGALGSMEMKRLTGADSAALYEPPGWLLWVREGALVARHLSVEKGELFGDTVVVANPVFSDNSHARLFSVSWTGLVTYRNGTPTEQLRWFDRMGKDLGALAEPAEKDGTNPSNARVSPDGRRVVLHRRARDKSDLWLIDASRASRFTFDGAGGPVWSPDGREIAFGAGETGAARYFQGFYRRSVDNPQNNTLVVDSLPDISALNDWSPDGKFLLYQSVSLKTGYDLWTTPLDGKHKPQVFLQTRFDEKYARFSPDSRWVAYTSNESGKSEVYIRAFDGSSIGSAGNDKPGPLWQVSVNGGLFPAWRHDGKELFWVGPGGRIMAAPVTASRTALQPGQPVQLFQAPIFGGGLDVNTGGEEFDVASDGRFLINTVHDSAATAVTLLQNWKWK